MIKLKFVAALLVVALLLAQWLALYMEQVILAVEVLLML